MQVMPNKWTRAPPACTYGNHWYAAADISGLWSQVLQQWQELGKRTGRKPVPVSASVTASTSSITQPWSVGKMLLVCIVWVLKVRTLNMESNDQGGVGWVEVFLFQNRRWGGAKVWRKGAWSWSVCRGMEVSPVFDGTQPQTELALPVLWQQSRGWEQGARSFFSGQGVPMLKSTARDHPHKRPPVRLFFINSSILSQWTLTLLRANK